jgi:hypothetical protein
MEEEAAVSAIFDLIVTRFPFLTETDRLIIWVALVVAGISFGVAAIAAVVWLWAKAQLRALTRGQR